MNESSRLIALCLVLTSAAVSTISETSFAQPVKGAPAPKPPAGQTPPAPAGPAGSTPAEPSKADVAKATSSFKQGTQLFGQKKFALALQQFQTSYDTVPSPNSRLYIARCQAEMGELKVAFRTFQKVIEEADQRAQTEAKYAPTRESAKVELEDLSKKLVLVTVNVQNPQPTTRVRLMGAVLPKEEWGKPSPVDPGKVEIVVETDGVPPITRTLELNVGDRPEVPIDAAPPAAVVPPVVDPEPVEDEGSGVGLLPIAIAAGGIGVVGMTIYAVAGVMTNNTHSELEEQCGNSPCPAAASQTIDRGEEEKTIANVGFTIGVVGLAAGATFLIIDLATRDGGESDPEAAAAARRKPSVDLDVGPGYIGASGRF